MTTHETTAPTAPAAAGALAAGPLGAGALGTAGLEAEPPGAEPPGPVPLSGTAPSGTARSSAPFAAAPLAAGLRPDSPTARRRAFAVVFMIELWERFGFYGMAVLMVLFMVQGLGYSDRRANLAWGAMSALVYAVPALGGWLGDRWIGTRRAMLVGTVVLGCGYALLAIPFDSPHALFGALALVAIGNGLFKPNAANLVRRIYEGDPARIDSAFTIYYMAVNVGSVVSMLATPWVKEVWGWHAAFAVCAVGLACGLFNYALMRRALDRVGGMGDRPRTPAGRLLLIAAGLCAVAVAATLLLSHEELAAACMAAVGGIVVVAWTRLAWRSPQHERRGMAAAALLTLLVALYFVFFQQMSTSLTLFALRNVDGHLQLAGLPLGRLLPAQFLALNSAWVIVLGPPLAWIYARLARGPGDFSIGFKFALGFASVASGFALLVFGCHRGEHGLVSAWYMVGCYGLLSLGELLISGLGLAVMARYVPARISGFVMGGFFAAVGLAMYSGSYMATMAQQPVGIEVGAQASLHAYTGLFGRLSSLALLGCVVSLALLPLLRWLVPAGASGAQR